MITAYSYPIDMRDDFNQQLKLEMLEGFNFYEATYKVIDYMKSRKMSNSYSSNFKHLSLDENRNPSYTIDPYTDIQVDQIFAACDKISTMVIKVSVKQTLINQYMLCLTAKEEAKIYGVKASAIKQRRVRAKKTIRRLLKLS